MASRKNLVLASLVSLVMVLSFGIGLVPMLTVSPDQSAKAAPGAVEVAISVDGATPVGASYAVPVGSEQGFSALRLFGDSAESLAGGAVEWSLATDGSAKLVSAADAAVATVQALAPGEAGLYVRTADGLVAVVDLTFFDLKPVPLQGVSTVTVLSPVQGANIVIQTGTATPMTLTAETDLPADVAGMRYMLDAAGTIVAGYSTTPPYAVEVPDVLALNPPFVRAEAFSIALDQYVQSAGVTFTVEQADLDGVDANDPNGIPDDPFGAGLLPGEEWFSNYSNNGFSRTVGMTPLAQPTKAVTLPADGVTLTLADPDDASRWVRVTAPAGLVQAGQDGLLLVAIADSPTELLGATQAANLATPPLTLVSNGQYVSVNILIQEGATWSSLSDVSANPVVIEMGGLVVGDNESATFSVHPADAVAVGADTEIVVPAGETWQKVVNGSVVTVGEMSAELTTLGVTAPFVFATSPNIVSITPSSVSNLGGTEVRIALVNVTNGDPVTVTIDGQPMAGTVNTVGTLGVTVTAPVAATLATAAASAAINVRVDVGSDFDALPGGLTYLGPQVDSFNPAAGGPATSITITGSRFQDDPGTSVTIGDAVLTVDSINAEGTQIVAHLGNNILPDSGSAPVRVTNANQYTGISSDGFVTTVAGPVLSSVTPESVYAGTSYSLNLLGQNFIVNAAKQQVASAQVYFVAGLPNPAIDTPAASVSTWSAQSITARTPASLPAGLYGIYVATSTYTVGQPDVITQTSNILPVQFVDPNLAQVTIGTVTPAEGPLAGGTQVTITGTGFPNVSPAVLALIQAAAAGYENYAVYFGANKAIINDVTPTNLVVTTPAGAQASLVDVRVQNPQAAGPGNFAIKVDGFEYIQPVLAVAPQTAYSVTGPQGGPIGLFTPSSKLYTVSNSGNGTLVWTAAKDVGANWLTLSSNGGSLTAGASAQETLSVNAFATTLGQGNYTATVTFDDADATVDPIVVTVNLTVGPPNTPILGVTPSADLISSGNPGGPFSPTNIDYTVTNTGGGTLNWTASVPMGVNWVDVSSGGGALGGGASANVNVSINSNANVLAPGLHQATVTFSDGTTSVTRAVSLTVAQPVLLVVPDSAFASFGPAGGPFAPLSKTYMVYNMGSGELIWDANLVYSGDAPAWLMLTKNLASQAGSATIDLTPAAGLLEGSSSGTTYSTTLQFTGNGGTTTRDISLTVFSRPAIDSVAPRNIGPPAGGMTVYLRGSNLMPTGGTTRVFFTSAAGVADPSIDAEGLPVTVFSDSVLAVVVPPHVAGTFDVYVVTAVNTPSGLIEQRSNLAQFIYAEPTMNVDTVAPVVGPLAGNTPVTITGSDFPNAGTPIKTKLLSTTGTSLVLSDAVYNVFGTASTIRVDMSLLRGAEANYASGPASITGSILFDPAVLEFVSISRNIKLRDWYSKNIDFALDLYDSGKVNFVISGGSNMITTFDNQIANNPPDELHNPTDQLNPFPLGNLTFRSMTTDGIQVPVTVSDLAMVDSDAVAVPNVDSDSGSVSITAAAAEIQIEDTTVNENASGVDVDFNLFRPEGSNLLTGPASITLSIDYDQTKLIYLDADPSAELVAWYQKGISLINDDSVNGVVTLLIADSAKALAEITTVDPNSTNQINPFPLGTLHFGKKQGVEDLNGVGPLTVSGLTMLDKNGQTFPGAGGLGDVGAISVTLMPQVFFGANAALNVASSTYTQILATTPAGDRREIVDVLVVDPTVPGPGNYGFKADAFTYQQPELGVSPAADFVSTGTQGTVFFNPASAAYQIYNIYDGTLNWTAGVDQGWVTLSATSGSISDSTITTLTASINSTASQLAIGTHEATITFGGNGGTTTRKVILTITGEATLRVEPLTGVEFTGVPGGPFAPSSRAFNVYNDGQGNLSWTVVDDASWLDVAPASGVNEGTVTVTLNAAANALGAGTYVANLNFNSTGGAAVRTVTLTVIPEGEPQMVVTPETGLDSSGPQGGPFTPLSKAYTVYNPGGGVLNYTATTEATWLDVLNGSGSLLGGNSALVTVAIDTAAAAALTASNTPIDATLSFDDGVGGLSPTLRSISLSVFNLTVTAPNGGEEFERGDVVPIQWTYTGPSSNSQVRIELVDGTSGTLITTLSAGTANAQTPASNTFNWTVAANAPLGRDFKIRVTATADNRATDSSNTAFAIIEPSFEVLNPAAGEDVSTGAAFTLQWNYYEITEAKSAAKANGLVDIWLYQGTSEIEQIGNNVLNHPFDEDNSPNGHIWNVPANQTLGNDFRIVFKDSDSEEVLGGMPIGGVGFQIVPGKTRTGLGALLIGLIAALFGLAGGDKGGGGGGPCFIATAAYGTPMAAQIDTLREFRDMYMLSNPLGMAAADAYYQISPAIADVVAKFPLLAALVRIALAPVILVAKLAVTMPIPSMALAAFGAVMLALRRLRRSREKA